MVCSNTGLTGEAIIIVASGSLCPSKVTVKFLDDLKYAEVRFIN